MSAFDGDLGTLPTESANLGNYKSWLVFLIFTASKGLATSPTVPTATISNRVTIDVRDRYVHHRDGALHDERRPASVRWLAENGGETKRKAQRSTHPPGTIRYFLGVQRRTRSWEFPNNLILEKVRQAQKVWQFEHWNSSKVTEPNLHEPRVHCPVKSLRAKSAAKKPNVPQLRALTGPSHPNHPRPSTCSHPYLQTHIEEM